MPLSAGKSKACSGSIRKEGGERGGGQGDHHLALTKGDRMYLVNKNSTFGQWVPSRGG